MLLHTLQCTRHPTTRDDLPSSVHSPHFEDPALDRKAVKKKGAGEDQGEEVGLMRSTQSRGEGGGLRGGAMAWTKAEASGRWQHGSVGTSAVTGLP